MRRIDRPPIPREVRSAVIRRARGVCEDCGRAVSLELHHLSYQIEEYMVSGHLYGGEPIFGKETPDDLVALCRDCHNARHVDIGGQFWPDPQAMREFWEPYFEALGKDD